MTVATALAAAVVAAVTWNHCCFRLSRQPRRSGVFVLNWLEELMAKVPRQ